MEYVESLLEEYFDVSQTFIMEKDNGAIHQDWLESVLAIEEEICWEFSVPPTNKFRDLFRMIPNGVSKEDYVSNAIQNLSREKTRYFYRPNESIFDMFKAA